MEKLFTIGLTYLLMWPSIFCFGLKLFRFPLKLYIPQIGLATLILAQCSVLLQTTSLIYFLSTIHFLLGLTVIWLLFRIQLHYAFFMMLITYFIISIAEFTVNWLVPSTFITIVNEDNVLHFLWGGFIISIFTSVFTVLLHYKRLGFTFIPQSRTARRIAFVGNPLIKALAIVVFPIVFIESLLFFLYPRALIVQSLVMIILLTVLVHKSFRWEMGE